MSVLLDRLFRLGREGSGIRNAVAHPSPERLVAFDRFRVDAKPAIHLASSHLETAHMRLACERLSLGRVNAEEQAALTAGANRHVAANQEGETAEHAFLCKPPLALNQLADSVRQILVIRHSRSIADQADNDEDPDLLGIHGLYSASMDLLGIDGRRHHNTIASGPFGTVQSIIGGGE
jgi:hypothetical protein